VHDRFIFIKYFKAIRRPMHFYPKLFLMLTSGFALFVIIGTQCHELGHYLVGKLLGYNVKLHYASVSLYSNIDSMRSFRKLHDSLYALYPEQFTAKGMTPVKEILSERIKRGYSPYHIWFTIGGPLQTILTGTCGLLLILVFRNRFRNRETLSFGQWLLIFFTLFWLRQPANMISGILGWMLKGRISQRSDEINLDHFFHLPQMTLSIITGLIGFAVLAFVTFRVIPKNRRITFMAAGLAGAACGVVLWFFLLGPLVLP
jgi:hypothetical protein